MSRRPMTKVERRTTPSLPCSFVIRHSSSPGTTLIEAMIPIGIVVILAWILFPVFRQARETARSPRCLANCRQIGAALALYLQDWDGGLPLTGDAGPFPNCFHALQVYSAARLLRRCPNDCSDNFHPEGRRHSSYVVNSALATGYGIRTVDQVKSPAETIYLAESTCHTTADRFHPVRWVNDSRHTAGEELDLDRHCGASNYLFLDGHARRHRFEETWNPAANLNRYDPAR